MISLVFLNFGKIEERRRKRAIPSVTAEMGRANRIIKLPSEKIKDCRNAFSIRGPNTKAKSIGAGS